MRSYTDLEQSKKLAELLPIDSADMGWNVFVDGTTRILPIDDWNLVKDGSGNVKFHPAWSLAALLEELNRNCWKVSLKCCGAEWDMTYDDGERYISVPSDYAIDACVEMIIKLHEQKLLQL